MNMQLVRVVIEERDRLNKVLAILTEPLYLPFLQQRQQSEPSAKPNSARGLPPEAARPRQKTVSLTEEFIKRTVADKWWAGLSASERRQRVQRMRKRGVGVA